MKRTALFLLSALALAAACADSGGMLEVRQDPDDIFWRLELNQTAVNLSLDDSEPRFHQFQLVASPLRLDGSPFPLEGDERVEYTSSDTTRVHVTEDGLVTARGITPASSPVTIVAKLTAGDDIPITNVDTAYVVVTPDVRPIQSLSIQPTRTSFGVGWDTIMAAQIFDADGAPVTGVRVAYESSLPKVASYGSDGLVMLMNEGKVTLRASTVAYGDAYEDSVELTVTEPDVFQVINHVEIYQDGSYALAFDPVEIHIRAGQGVAFVPGSAGCVYGVDFDDPTDVGPSPVDGASGNIPFFCGIGDRRIRTFPEPGVYQYEGSPMFGFPTVEKGRVIVEP